MQRPDLICELKIRSDLLYNSAHTYVSSEEEERRFAEKVRQKHAVFQQSRMPYVFVRENAIKYWCTVQV